MKVKEYFMPIKFVLDTDIGTDVDDAYALLLSLASPELDIVAVTLVHADLDMRAKIAAKLLTLAKRTDIPVYKGISDPISSNRGHFWGGYEGEGVDLSGAEGVRVQDGAVDALIDLAARYGKELVISPIGPLTNIAMAIRKAPDVMRGIGRLCIMASTFSGLGVAGREHNINADPVAAQEVLNSGIPATVVGLNVTMQVTLKDENVKGLQGRSPLGDYMAGLAERFFQACGRRWTHMHDPLAVACLVNPSIVRTEYYHGEVITEGEDAGMIIYTEEGEPKVDVAVDVDTDAFDEHFISRAYALADSVKE